MSIERFVFGIVVGCLLCVLSYAFNPPKLVTVSEIDSTDKQASSVMLFIPLLWHYLSVDETDTHITAIARYMKEEANTTLLSKLYPRIITKNEALTSVGAVPLGVEQILFLHPSRILSWEHFSSKLKAINYQGLVTITTKEYENKSELFDILGKITDKESRVQWLLQREQKQIHMIEQHIPHDTSYTSIIVLGNLRNFSMWNAKAIDFNDNLKRIHGVNLAETMKASNASINVETLIHYNPDVLFLPSYTDDLITPHDIYSDPKLISINAVKNHRVYLIPSGASRMEGPIETPILLEWMAVLLHPELSSSFHLRETVRTTYNDVYGYNLSQKEIDKLLHLKENMQSAHYDIFQNHTR